MRRIILAVTTAAAIAWIAWPDGAAAWMPAGVQPLALPVLATIIAAALLDTVFRLAREPAAANRG